MCQPRKEGHVYLGWEGLGSSPSETQTLLSFLVLFCFVLTTQHFLVPGSIFISP